MRTTFTTTLGAARRSSVETMGPSRSRRVRAAPGAGTDSAGTAWAIDTLPLFIGNSCPRWRGWSSAWTERLGKTGWLLESPIARELSNFPAETQRIVSQPRPKNFHAIFAETGYLTTQANKADAKSTRV